MLITAQSNGVKFPTNLRYNIHHSDLRILRQTELLLQIVPDSLRFLTAIWKQVNRETAGDRRRQSQTVAGTLTIIWKPGFVSLESSLFVLLAINRQKTRKRKHRFWVRKIFQQREKLGFYNTSVRELKLHDREYFYMYQC